VTRAKQTIPGSRGSGHQGSAQGGDFAIVLGAGFSVDRFTVEGRYTAGLTNLNKDAADVNQDARVRGACRREVLKSTLPN
jgi:hypothetical protein